MYLTVSLLRIHNRPAGSVSIGLASGPTAFRVAQPRVPLLWGVTVLLLLLITSVISFQLHGEKQTQRQIKMYLFIEKKSILQIIVYRPT